MTNQEKIIRHDAKVEIRKRIAGCFGFEDKIFANHHEDEDRAKALGKFATENKITAQELVEIAAGYLLRCDCIGDHLKEQLKQVSKFYS